ncbi:MAG: glycosyltransferase family 4 protein [Actinomycetota bacterium]|nr:glycosyltransferase family 4 protein [Actinomycetota bacterium]
MAAPVIVFGLTVPMSLTLQGNRFGLLADAGCEVHVVLGEPLPENAVVDPRVQVHVIAMTRSIAPFADFKSLLAWRRFLKQLRPSHVVGATPKAAFLSMLAARNAKVPHRILEVWGGRWDGFQGSRARLLRLTDTMAMSAATEVIAVSNSLADLVVSAGLSNQRPIVLGYGGTQGVDLEQFHAADEPVEPTVGFLGRLAADKGIDDLRAVMALVHEVLPDVRLRVAGDFDSADPIDLNTREWLEADARVTLVGHVAEVPKFLRSISVLCFPSHREGLPNAVIEAAASEVPVVAWNVTGTRDAIIDGQTGALVPLGNIAQMADRICTLVSDAGIRAEQGRAARALVAERFEASKVQQSFVRHLLDD